MTDTRMERIINQLAELTEEEEQVLIDRIAEARKERREKKFNELKTVFFNTWKEIENLGYGIQYRDDFINKHDIEFY